MKRLIALVFVIAAWLAAAANATTLTIPNTFTPGGQITASGFNQNFTTIQTWSTNIDNSNIGSLGIYASQILPVTSAEATFGGTITYTFPNSIQVTGTAILGVGVNSSSAAGGVLCSGADFYQTVSPFTTYECIDTSGDVGAAGFVTAGNTNPISLGYPSALTTPFIANSSDGGINISYPSTSTLAIRMIEYTSGTPGAIDTFTPTATTLAGAVTSGSTISAGTYLNAEGHSVPYDTRYSNQANYHIEAGTITDVAGSGGTYAVTFIVSYANTPETCIITPQSYSGSNPTTGVIYITGFTGSGPYTGFSMKNNLNAAVNASYLCLGD